MTEIDTLLHSRWVIPVDDDKRCLEYHSIAIHEGSILEILPTESARQNYQAITVHELGHHALMPGLVNAHTHAAMTLFRGLADDLALMDWLQNHIWPAESRWVNENFVQTGTELAIAEMIRSGTTCFNDMYFFPDVTARVASNAGMRASIGLIVLDFPTVWANDADEYIEKGSSLFDTYKNEELITTAFAPHAPYTVSDEPLRKIRTLSDELDIPVHMHVHETADEVREAVENTGKRPLTRLDEIGLLSPALNAVHMTQLEDDEIERLAEAGCHVIHCPESNLKLASGLCRVSKLIEKGVNVAIGTDGTASNNNLDMLGELQTAALLAKGVSGDATSVSAHQALEMATINGARALGLADAIGSLETGKSADIIAIDFDALELSPVYDPISHIAYSCTRDRVCDAWIAGRHVMSDHTLTTLDSNAILSDVRMWQEKISQPDQ